MALATGPTDDNDNENNTCDLTYTLQKSYIKKLKEHTVTWTSIVRDNF